MIDSFDPSPPDDGATRRRVVEGIVFRRRPRAARRSPSAGGKGGGGLVFALGMLAVWAWIAHDVTRWLFPFSGRWLLWLLTLATACGVLGLIGVARRLWKRRAARLHGRPPPPLPTRRDWALLGVYTAIVVALGVVPTARIRGPLTRPHVWIAHDRLGYDVVMETRLGWWGATYRASVRCPGPTACQPAARLSLWLNDAATGDMLDGSERLLPASISRAGSRWTTEGRFNLIHADEYRRARAKVIILPGL